MFSGLLPFLVSHCCQLFPFAIISKIFPVAYRFKTDGKKTPALFREAIGSAKLLQKFRIHQMFFEKFFKNLKNFHFSLRTLRFFLVCGCKVISLFWDNQRFYKIILKKIKFSIKTPLRSHPKAISSHYKKSSSCTFEALQLDFAIILILCVKLSLKVCLKTDISENSFAIIEILSNFAAQTKKKK